MVWRFEINTSTKLLKTESKAGIIICFTNRKYQLVYLFYRRYFWYFRRSTKSFRWICFDLDYSTIFARISPLARIATLFISQFLLREWRLWLTHLKICIFASSHWNLRLSLYHTDFWVRYGPCFSFMGLWKVSYGLREEFTVEY